MINRKQLILSGVGAGLGLAGCGGGGANHQPSRAEGVTAHVSVDVRTGKGTVTHSTSRAILVTGATISVTPLVDLNGLKVIDVTLTNRLAIPIGQSADGTPTLVRVILGGGSTASGTISATTSTGTADASAVRLANSDGYDVVGNPYVTYPGPIAANSSAKKTWAFAVAPGVVSFSFSVTVEPLTTPVPAIPDETGIHISLLSGIGIGYTNGPANVSKWFGPTGLAQDSKGAIFVADCINNSIRRIDPNGNSSTIAGSLYGNSGYVDGPGTVAMFNNPVCLCLGHDGAIYIVDRYNHMIRRMSQTGPDPSNSAHWAVGTIAGRIAPGYIDQNGLNSRFNNPMGIVSASTNTLYVADGFNQRVRMLRFSGGNPNDPAQWLVSTHTNTAIPFSYGIGIDPSGNIILNPMHSLDSFDTPWPFYSQIQKLSPSGALTTVATRITNGLGAITHKLVGGPIAVDGAGNTYAPITTQVSDLRAANWDAMMLAKITPSGNITILTRTKATGYPVGIHATSSGTVILGATNQIWKLQKTL